MEKEALIFCHLILYLFIVTSEKKTRSKSRIFFSKGKEESEEEAERKSVSRQRK